LRCYVKKEKGKRETYIERERQRERDRPRARPRPLVLLHGALVDEALIDVRDDATTRDGRLDERVEVPLVSRERGL